MTPPQVVMRTPRMAVVAVGGDGGGNDAGNAGSGFFDSPLATKARRRANDFDNAGGEDEDDGTFADVDPDGESL